VKKTKKRSIKSTKTETRTRTKIGSIRSTNIVTRTEAKTKTRIRRKRKIKAGIVIPVLITQRNIMIRLKKKLVCCICIVQIERKCSKSLVMQYNCKFNKSVL
jgi:hypothetical protein